MTQQVETAKKRDIPLWLGIGLVVLGLAAAGWFVWSQTNGFWTGSGGVFTIEGSDPSAGGGGGGGVVRPMRGMRRQASAPPTGAIFQHGNSFTVRTGPFGGLIKKGDGNTPRVTISVSMPDILPEDYKWLSVIRQKFDDVEAVKAMGLTPKEAEKLKALPVSTRFSLTPSKEDLATLTQIAAKYIAADAAAKMPLDQEFAKALTDIGGRLSKDIPAQVKSDYAAAETAITTERWAKLKAYAVDAPAVAPSTQPAK